MGTVGLSFGSPTSGAGFDVSSTVASIVSNLQNVETPWKNQLATLESQDTVISSLGTLFSHVSNDMSQLTDFQGILAEKEGSSSDENVLTLTSANASAVAGTYTVEVQSLAQTSSGYLTAVNASGTLSGSITLQVGSSLPQTITLGSSDNTLAGLASAINSSTAGVTANVMTTSSGSVLSLVSGTSGADGDLTITSNISDAKPISLGYSDTGYTSNGNFSSGSLSAVGSTDALGGSVSIAVGSGTAQPISMSAVESAEGGATLADLAAYIASNSSTLGFTASVVTSNGQSVLSLQSGTAGSAGALTVTSSLTDSTPTLGFNSTVTGSNAQMTINGISNLSSSSNTVTDLIPGVTFQLLAPSATESNGSLEQVQVVIGNNNTGVESTVNQFVTDYNSLVSAMNTQQGNTSSGTAEPLFGSPTLSLLQQQLMSSVNTQSPTGSLSSIASNSGVTLSGSMVISLGNGGSETINIGAPPPGDVSGNGVYYTGSGSDANTLAGLAAAINAAATDTSIRYTAGSDNGSGSITASSSAAMSGDLSIGVGSSTVLTVDMDDVDAAEGGTTLADIATYITANSSSYGVTATTTDNGDGTSTLALSTDSLSGDALTVDSTLVVPGSGVTAAVVTADGESQLTLLNAASGINGALSVTSSIVASTPAALTYSDTSGSTSSSEDSGTVGAAGANDTLTGSITFQAGTGSTTTVSMAEVTAAEGGATVSDLANYIQTNYASDVTATTVTNSDGTLSLSLTSNTDGSAGALTVTSHLFDSNNATTATLNYTASSDVNSLTSLGISLNNDGSMTFDASTLDSLLNSDFNGVTSFFQDANSWGQSFATMLDNAGSSSKTGILALASTSNSDTESTLNADMTKENALISTEQASLTAELNSANEIMQELPSQLDGMNELYSAITGYDQGTNG